VNIKTKTSDNADQYKKVQNIQGKYFLCTKKANGQLHALAALPPGRSSWYLINKRLGWTHRQSGCFGLEKNLLTLARI
jgi:hypothetical protein